MKNTTSYQRTDASFSEGSNKAWNYRLKHKLPTKKQEKDFVDNLKLSQKQLTYLETVEMPKSGNWEGVSKDNFIKKVINRIMNRKSGNYVYFK